jgi:hypothetical protein
VSTSSGQLIRDKTKRATENDRSNFPGWKFGSAIANWADALRLDWWTNWNLSSAGWKEARRFAKRRCDMADVTPDVTPGAFTDHGKVGLRGEGIQTLDPDLGNVLLLQALAGVRIAMYNPGQGLS